MVPGNRRRLFRRTLPKPVAGRVASARTCAAVSSAATGRSITRCQSLSVLCCERPAVGDANFVGGVKASPFFSGGVVFAGLMGCGLCRGAPSTEILQNSDNLDNLSRTSPAHSWSLTTGLSLPTPFQTLIVLLTGTPYFLVSVLLVYALPCPRYITASGQLQRSAFAGVRGCACFWSERVATSDRHCYRCSLVSG